MVSVWRDGGGRGDLPIDVERWEGVTQEEGRVPEAVKEWNDEERRVRTWVSLTPYVYLKCLTIQLFAGPVNSEPPRRRADTVGSLNSPAEGPRERRDTFSRLGGGQSSPMRERFGNTGVLGGGIAGRRRRDDTAGGPYSTFDLAHAAAEHAADPPPLRQRQSSFTGQPLSAINPPTPGGAGARRPMGTFDGVLGRESGREEGAWGRRKLTESGGINGAGIMDTKRSFPGLASGASEGTGNATVAWSTAGGAGPARTSGDDGDLPPNVAHNQSPDTYHHPSFDPNPDMGVADSPEPAFHGDLNGVTAGLGAVSISDGYSGSRLGGMQSSPNPPGFAPPRSTSASSLAPESVQWYYKDPTGLIQGGYRPCDGWTALTFYS